ncbi:hypothetical protein N0V90_003219 [Kalmusia sp. IMI 367209]|nr:hypothetical protein N0V90_003219 [Kalmusia sp. IMI 367209]
MLENLRSLLQRYFGAYRDPTYIAYPLDVSRRDIRLVYVERGDWHDEIKCRLDVVSLDSKPDFEALSYAWGDASQTRHICLGRKRVEVGINLQSALRRLRRTNEDRALWVDAICINQRDVQERNEQVLLMKDIYRTCRNVLIWLGEPEGYNNLKDHPSKPHEWSTNFSQLDEELAIHEVDERTMLDFERDIKTYYRLPFSLRHSMSIDRYLGAYCLMIRLAQNKHLLEKDISFLLNHDAFHRFILALDEIMHCQWWSRQWVIQEVVLPTSVKVYFGNFVAPWDLLGRAAHNYELHRTSCCENHYINLHWNDIRLLENFSRTVVQVDNLRRNLQSIARGDSGILISLRQLLWKFRDRNTSDPRDTIYTLVPLANYWNGELAITPDYYPTTQQVFCAAVKTIVAVDNTLEILMGTMEKDLTGLPSWVPDWTRKPSRFEEERLERCCLFRASLNHKLEIEFIHDTYLKVGGVYFDEVIAIAEIMDFSSEEKCHELFASWYAFICRNGPITTVYPSGGTKMEAYWRTLCLDTARSINDMDIGNRYTRCSEKYVEEGQERWMDEDGMPLREIGDDEPSHLDLGKGASDDTVFAQEVMSPPSPPKLEKKIRSNDSSTNKLKFVAVDFAICSATWSRRLFFTRRGFIGIGPPSMQEGDTVQVFGGGSMPFIIRDIGRKRVSGVGAKTCYKLLGECYLHGIMDGEAVREYEQRQVITYLA